MLNLSALLYKDIHAGTEYFKKDTFRLFLVESKCNSGDGAESSKIENGRQ